MKRIGIVGGGIIGLATAYKILKRYPGTKVHLFEKERSPGMHQSGRNSGVLHCGLYYLPGSLKARLAVEGIREMTTFCREHGVQHDICGKVVAACNEQQKVTLHGLAQRGSANGLKGLAFLSKSQLNEREPNVRAVDALIVPEEGIADYQGVMHKLTELILNLGGEIHVEQPIWKINISGQTEINVSTSTETFTFDRLVCCAGLFADHIYEKFTGLKCPLKIVPFRGEYLSFKPAFKEIVNHLIYPVPDVKYPFLGVHFTRMINGEREVGPNAVLALKREGYSNAEFNIHDALESLSYPGLMNFLRNNLKFAVNELSSSLFMSAFITKAKALIPEIEANMLIKGTSGVRAQAMDKQGNLLMDFNIKRVGNQIHILNAPSPGATASLAIAGYILDHYLNDIN